MTSARRMIHESRTTSTAERRSKNLVVFRGLLHPLPLVLHGNPTARFHADLDGPARGVHLLNLGPSPAGVRSGVIECLLPQAVERHHLLWSALEHAAELFIVHLAALVLIHFAHQLRC